MFAVQGEGLTKATSGECHTPARTERRALWDDSLELTFLYYTSWRDMKYRM
jgi:hypothetical protein